MTEDRKLAIESQNIYATIALMLLCVASIIIGVVMLKGGFGGRLGYLAIAAGILTLFSPLGVMIGVPLIVPFFGLVLMAVWQLLADAKLYRLGRNGA